MFKFVAIFALAIAAASAGLIGHHGAIAVAPAHASSYANSNLVAIHPQTVAVAHSAPIAVAHAAPIAVPAVSVGIAHGGLIGGHGGLLGGHGGLLGGHGGLIGGHGLIGHGGYLH